MKGSRLLMFVLASWCGSSYAQTQWTFAVSGDSRNCGNVVMPAIAQKTTAAGYAFYWHLGDFRALSFVDEDILAEPRYRSSKLSIIQYRNMAWPDFIEHQLLPFGTVPVYLGIGNHELAAPKTLADYLITFAKWLDAPDIKAQRLKDPSSDHRLKSYYSLVKSGIDFITLDNADDNSFDAPEVAWALDRLAKDERDPEIKTIVAGMHEALPGSMANQHSMQASAHGIASGKAVYSALVHARDSGKKVYVLASHSHFYMANIFDTPELRASNSVLPGWIVGTAGAHRYRLPAGVATGPDAKTDVYGYLTGSVRSDGTIDFAFQKLEEEDLQRANKAGYTREFVHECFTGNHD